MKNENIVIGVSKELSIDKAIENAMESIPFSAPADGYVVSKILEIKIVTGTNLAGVNKKELMVTISWGYNIDI
ncbi:hypothetical protein [Grimontia marina]|uniref:Uncharacterized protein n=1 Tax=Grimontia marina TaxID=646534 RepID=A0A128F8K8_9GAMM|nr:hypothetical protein [Grimontia marina]CZF82636.1 hypothetical protein GMA8713_02299 [Grimontia marina]